MATSKSEQGQLWSQGISQRDAQIERLRSALSVAWGELESSREALADSARQLRELTDVAHRAQSERDAAIRERDDAMRRAGPRSGYTLAPVSLLPWVLWAMFDEAEIGEIVRTRTLVSDWFGPLPLPDSACQSIERAWSEAASSRWQSKKRAAERAGYRDRVKARLTADGVPGDQITDRAADLFAAEVERLVQDDPWPHTHDRWSRW